MNPRSRRIALAALALGVLTLAGAGFAVRNTLIQNYWILKLERGDVQEQVVAAVKVGKNAPRPATTV